jgi:hypothetical protein
MRATVPRSAVTGRVWEFREVGYIELAQVDLTQDLSEQQLPDLGAAGDVLRGAVRHRWTGLLLPELESVLAAGPPAAVVVARIGVQPEWEDRALDEQLLAEALRVFTREARFAVFDPRLALPATQLRKVPYLGARLQRAGFLPHAGLYLAPLRDLDFQQRAHRLVDKWLRQRLAEGP